MKLKVNKRLLPIKAHFFFFFAALGPLLPQMNVFGRQLGISPEAMGFVTAVLPLLWAAAKPLFGYVVDYWPAQRKLVFMLLITVMTGSYCGLWFLPVPEALEYQAPITRSVYHLNETVLVKSHQGSAQPLTCRWSCDGDDVIRMILPNVSLVDTVFMDGAITNTSCSLLRMTPVDVGKGQAVCSPREGCDLLCYEDSSVEDAIAGGEDVSEGGERNTSIISDTKVLERDRNVPKLLKGERNASEMLEGDASKGKERDGLIVESGGKSGAAVYLTAVFWVFVVLMCIGTVAFNVANCIGDAVCFDVLGPEGGSKYGAQRAWGTAGYGITALLGGWLVDTVSGTYKDFTPAFIIALVATAIDLFSCRALTLPSLSSPDDSGKALREVLRIPRVLIFIVFAIVAGTFDSFIIYYMFWFLEELAEQTGCMGKIKLIEGVVVAAQSFIGELLFFFFSGKILDRWGYRTTLTFCLFCYGIRMALISFIEHPWHLVFIEAIMQGPTYALCYSTIVGYAAHVAPEGYSATVQGIVAGMDDGVGFAAGSLLGGQLYAVAGGRGAFRWLAALAGAATAAHALLAAIKPGEKVQAEQPQIEEGEKMLPLSQGTDPSSVYRDTVTSLTKENGSR